MAPCGRRRHSSVVSQTHVPDLKVYKDQIDAERAHVASLHVQVAIAVGPAAPLGLADVDHDGRDAHLALMDDDHDGHDAPLALMDIDWDDIE